MKKGSATQRHHAHQSLLLRNPGCDDQQLEFLTDWVSCGKAIQTGAETFQLTSTALMAYRVCVTLEKPKQAFSMEQLQTAIQQKRLASVKAPGPADVFSKPGVLQLTPG